MNLSKSVKVTKVLDYASAGTGTNNGTELDMQGFEGVMFVGGAIGTADAGNYYKVQQDETTGMASAADLEGTKVAPGDDGDGICIDLYRPQERFVRIVRVRGASSTAESVIAIQYSGRKPPIDNASDIDTELHVSPDEGTA